MFKHTPYLYQFGSAILISLAVCSPSQAEQTVNAHPDTGGMSFTTNKDHSGASITIVGPDGFVLEKKGASVADLGLYEGLADGVYKYEVTLAPMVKRGRRDGDEMSGQNRKTPGSISSGAFTVANGAILDPNIQE